MRHYRSLLFTAAAMGLAPGATLAATATDLPPPPIPGEVAEGLRFLGDREDYKVFQVEVQANDTEPMFVAVRNGQRTLGAFFRAGELQCYDGKFGGIPVRCDSVRETALPPYRPGVSTYPSGFPGLTYGPGFPGVGVPFWPGNPGHPGIDIPPDVIYCPGHPRCPRPDKPDRPDRPDRPDKPEEPQPAPVPLPASMILMLLALFGFGGVKLMKFAGEYESLRAQCCGDPDRRKAHA